MNNLIIYNGIFFPSASILSFLILLQLISFHISVFVVLSSLSSCCSSSSIPFPFPSPSSLTSSTVLSASVRHPSVLPAVPLMSVDDAGGLLAD